MQQQQGEMTMQTWEYKTIQTFRQGGSYQWSSSHIGFLNEMGQQGWELVSVVERERNTVEWIFKRPQGVVVTMVGAAQMQAQASYIG